MTAPEVQAVLDGDHDDQLDALAEAIVQRKRMLDPTEALEDLLSLNRSMDSLGGLSRERQMREAVEAHGQIKKILQRNPSVAVQDYGRTLKVRILTEFLDMPREAALRSV